MRLEDLKKTLTLEYVGKDGVEKTMNFRLTVPYIDWSQNCFDQARLLASSLLQSGKLMRMALAGNETTKSLSDMDDYDLITTALGQSKVKPQIYSFYYIGADEKIYMDSSVPERIEAFNNCVLPFSPEEEAAIFDDFLERYTALKSSTRRSLERAVPSMQKTLNSSAPPA